METHREIHCSGYLLVVNNFRKMPLSDYYCGLHSGAGCSSAPHAWRSSLHFSRFLPPSQNKPGWLATTFCSGVCIAACLCVALLSMDEPSRVFLTLSQPWLISDRRQMDDYYCGEWHNFFWFITILPAS